MARNFASGDKSSRNMIFTGTYTSEGSWGIKLRTTSTLASCAPAAIGGSSLGVMFLVSEAASPAYVYSKGTSGATAFELMGATNVVDGEWHSILFTWTAGGASGINLYVDGALEASAASVSDTWYIAQQDTDFGKNSNTFWASFVGDMADSVFWSRQLTAGEAAEYGAGVDPLQIAIDARYSYVPMLSDFSDWQQGNGNGLPVTSGTTNVPHPPRLFTF